MKAQFKAIYLNVLAPFMAKSNIRYYLNGFYVEPAPENIGGVYLVATNGHALCVIHDETGSSDAAYILPPPTSLLARCKGEKIASFDGAMLSLGDETGTLESLKLTPIDGKYPDWRRVCAPPDISVAREIDYMCINPEYLARVQKSIKHISGGYTASRIICSDKNSSVYIMAETPDCHRVLFVIMPMRDNAASKAYDWIKQLASAATSSTETQTA